MTMDAKAAEGFCGHPVTASVGPASQEVGANNPPEPTPYEAARDRVNDLFGEASLWLDGAVVDSQELADGIGNLRSDILKARKAADEARKVENEPFDAGKAEVQARYNPLLKKADQATDACKAALKPWLDKKDAEIAAAAAVAREEADRKRREAEAAIRAADATNLAAREAAEALLKDAKKADTVASKAERATATAGGFAGKSAGLRTTWKARIADGQEVEALRWAWKTYPDEMKGCALTLAAREVAAGKHEIPGFVVEKFTSVV